MSERLNVLAVHAGGGIGGAPISLLQLLARLPTDDFRPVLAFTEAGRMAERAQETGLDTRVVPAPAAFFYSAHASLGVRSVARLLTHYASTLRVASRLMRSERPDVVHLNTSVLLPFAVAARRQQVPVVWHAREVLGPNPTIRYWHQRFICRHAAVVVATSRAVAACFQYQERIDVVPNAVDLDRFHLELHGERGAIRRELGLSKDAPVLAILGSVQPVKGHWVLLEAVERMRMEFPELIVLVVAGGVPESYGQSWKGRVKRLLGKPMDALEQLQRDAAVRRLSGALRFTGFRDDVERVLAGSDILVFPSLQPEGFGRPMMEAMAVARPVVASDMEASREVLAGEAGLLVPPGDAVALADALSRLLLDRQLSEGMGRAGRARVEQQFGLDRHVERMIDIYRRAASTSVPVAPTGL